MSKTYSVSKFEFGSLELICYLVLEIWCFNFPGANSFIKPVKNRFEHSSANGPRLI
jgi:hypothetical protein